MRLIKFSFLPLLLLAVTWISCSNDDDEDLEPGETLTELPAAFAIFDATNTTIILDGNEVVIETNGLPNHTSPYWSNTTARSMDGISTPAASTNHPLFVEPTVTTYEQMAPGNIDNFNGSYTLRVAAIPTKASSSSATGLGAIGIAVSGSVIYNDEEGPNIPLAGAVGSLDYNGAHTGPQSYHYHLEPVTFSDDDDNLIGIISDGFFLYGRKCTSLGAYPVDLDVSGGHTSTTKYNTEKEEYHYHIQNELYLSKYYILFPGNYQGSPNAIH
ncbi:YHYH protein [Algoriphagus aquimarinus]|uniref:YHYH protein n=1 Tax=Algoriphagus aquimarinus TaxID=237018 RepID=A0A1I1AJA4_9BACT|nr:YHYH protein [Algoriphagus aquimarinus]SFB38101.1 YHYH protein [Algoriphagus aquimarinus]